MLRYIISQNVNGMCYRLRGIMIFHSYINPLTLGTFCKKCVFWTFWWFLGWISANLPLIRSKMRLQPNSLPFLPPASRFSALWLGHAQKSKFFFAFPFSPFLFFLPQWLAFYWTCLQLKKTSEKASSRWAIFSLEQPGAVAGNFALSFSLNFLCISNAPFDIHSDLGIIGKIFPSCRSWV